MITIRAAVNDASAKSRGLTPLTPFYLTSKQDSIALYYSTFISFKNLRPIRRPRIKMEKHSQRLLI